MRSPIFRDLEAWEYVRTDVLSPLVAGRPDDAPIRVWIAGCASGEEAYINVIEAEPTT